MNDGLVRFVCLADDHAEGEPKNSPLTIVGREWAFCPVGAPKGHDWRRIEPTASWELRRAAARAALADAGTRRAAGELARSR